MDWKEIAKKHLQLECMALFALILCLAAGAVSEVCAAHDIFWLRFANFDTISLAIIQIQATVQTLSIALLALTSGYMTNSYMGIHFNRYLFQIKPRIFRQRAVVIALMVLLVANVFFYMAGWYNVVTGVFVAACILVCVCAWEIYGIFMGNTQITAEITAYIKYLASSGEMQDHRIAAFGAFCDGWKDCMESQSNREFDDYLSVYGLFQNALLQESSQARQTIQGEAASMIAAFGRSMSRSVRERGLVFLTQCYAQICKTIDNHRFFPAAGSVRILDKAFGDIVQLVQSLPLGSVEKHFDWFDFIYLVLKTNLRLGYEKENEFEALVDLSGFMGFYLTEHRKEGYNQQFWGSPLEKAEELLFGFRRDEQTAREMYEKVKFVYAVRLIQGGMFPLLKESFYQKALFNSRLVQTEPGARLILKVHCYLYYLAEYEISECVRPELQSDCAAFLRDGTIQSLFGYALECIGNLDDKQVRRGRSEGYVFTADLIHRMYNELRRAELYPLSGRAKIMVMDTVVKDFVIFCGLYIYDYLFGSSILERLIPDDAAPGYYAHFLQDPKTTGRLDTFLKLVACKDRKADAKRLLQVLESALFPIVKRNALRSAEQKQEAYEAETSRTEILKKVSCQIHQHLNQTFEGFLYQPQREEACVKIRTSSLHLMTDMELEKWLTKNLETWSREFAAGLCQTLIRLGAVRVRSLHDFADAQELVNYMQTADLSEVIDPWEVLSDGTLDSLIQRKTSLFADDESGILLLKKAGLRFCIRRVKIAVHCPVPREYKYPKNRKNYPIPVVNGITVDFTREELEKYLHDSRKVYDILFEISIRRAPGIIGDVFYLNAE